MDTFIVLPETYSRQNLIRIINFKTLITIPLKITAFKFAYTIHIGKNAKILASYKQIVGSKMVRESAGNEGRFYCIPI